MRTRQQRSQPAGPEGAEAKARFSAELAYRAAAAYYLEEQNQGQIAEALGVSRPTVSRLLAQARRMGIVDIRVRRPSQGDSATLEQATAESMGIDRVYVVPTVGIGSVGAALAPGVAVALSDAALESGDALLVSSGRTLYDVAHQALPQFPGVAVAPTAGGLQEPEPWWQTNEITRMYAERLAGHPTYLYAPAMPSALLSESLKVEPSFRKIAQMWSTAKAALLGVGAPPLTRSPRPAFFPAEDAVLAGCAGDVSSRFYDADGIPLRYPGMERLVAIGVDELRRIPAAIAVGAGREKVRSLRAGARGGFFNRLVTDVATAQILSKAEI